MYYCICHLSVSFLLRSQISLFIFVQDHHCIVYVVQYATHVCPDIGPHPALAINPDSNKKKGHKQSKDAVAGRALEPAKPSLSICILIQVHDVLRHHAFRLLSRVKTTALSAAPLNVFKVSKRTTYDITLIYEKTAVHPKGSFSPEVCMRAGLGRTSSRRLRRRWQLHRHMCCSCQ